MEILANFSTKMNTSEAAETVTAETVTIAPVTFVNPSYISVYDFERSFDVDYWRRWMGKYWTSAVYISIAYVCLIFGLRRWMQTRKPMKLTGMLIAWNFVLAVFSTVVTLRTMPEFLSVMWEKNGFHNTVCHWTQHNHATAFWSWLFMMSKVLELGDTAFVVLRKQKLLFLHWFHHAATLLSCWVVYEMYEPSQQWTVVMNAFVHSFMYTYYLLKAMGVKIPRSFALSITTIQLMQMVAGIYINIYSLNIILSDQGKCDRGMFGHQVPIVVYGIYFLLFVHFFYVSYIQPKKTTSKIHSKPLATTNSIPATIVENNNVPKESCNGNYSDSIPNQELLSNNKKSQ